MDVATSVALLRFRSAGDPAIATHFSVYCAVVELVRMHMCTLYPP